MTHSVARAALLGKTCRELAVAEHHLQQWESVLAKIVESRARRDFDFELPTHNGTRHLRARVEPELDESGEMQGILVLAKDRTQQLSIEAALRESEMRYASIFHRTKAITLLIDATSGKISNANQAACDFYGYTLQEIVEKFVEEVGTCSIEGVLSEVRASKQGATRYHSRHILKNGEVHDVDIFCSEIPIGGHPFLHAIVHDVSDTKRLEREADRYQNQALHASKLASLGTLAGGVAHEINNPLAIIKGLSYIARMKSAQIPGAESLIPMFEKQDAAVDRCAAIVDGLRCYAQGDADTIEELNLHQIIESNLAFCENIYKKSRITIERHFHCPNPIIRANRGKLQQVIMAILSNAKDALEEVDRGRIRIETCAGSQIIMLMISDNGCGIKQNVINQVFDPFFTTKPLGKGSGLGLSVVHGIVQSFDGNIQVESVPKLGTTLILTFPLAENSKLNFEHPERVEHLSGKVLIVEDEGGFRQTLETYLQSLGLEVSLSDDGMGALEILKRESFDYVVTDLRLPHMDGDVLLTEAAKLFLPNTKFVVMTGGILADFNTKQREAIRSHAHACLCKPFEFASLARTLKKIK